MRICVVKTTSVSEHELILCKRLCVCGGMGKHVVFCLLGITHPLPIFLQPQLSFLSISLSLHAVSLLIWYAFTLTNFVFILTSNVTFVCPPVLLKKYLASLGPAIGWGLVGIRVGNRGHCQCCEGCDFAWGIQLHTRNKHASKG